MTIVGLVGGAGTGKTHRLVDLVTSRVSEGALGSGQQVLGLTFMHGSRRRMSERLAAAVDVPSHVETLDAFSLSLVRRFRRRLGLQSGEVRVCMSEPQVDSGWWEERGRWYGSVQTVREAAAALLVEPDVRGTVRAAYPLVVVDELQDCSGGLLDVVSELGSATALLCAGDSFQDLQSADSRCAAIEWLYNNAEVEELELQRRTSSSHLLASAEALRSGTRAASGISVVPINGAGLAAYEIQLRIVQGWTGDLAAISPVGPERAPFAEQVVRYTSNTKLNGKIPAIPFSWETSYRHDTGLWVEEVCKPFSSEASVTTERLRKTRRETPQGPDAEVYDALARRMRLSGMHECDVAELREAAEAHAHRARVRSTGSGRDRRRAMTVHAAKNREFDHVFVLWPYQVSGTAIQQRKLLYNAITRARTDAVVLVQGGKARANSDSTLRLLR